MLLAVACRIRDKARDILTSTALETVSSFVQVTIIFLGSAVLMSEEKR